MVFKYSKGWTTKGSSSFTSFSQVRHHCQIINFLTPTKRNNLCTNHSSFQRCYPYPLKLLNFFASYPAPLSQTAEEDPKEHPREFNLASSPISKAHFKTFGLPSLSITSGRWVAFSTTIPPPLPYLISKQSRRNIQSRTLNFLLSKALHYSLRVPSGIVCITPYNSGND